jgi:adenine-specific DNA methylase
LEEIERILMKIGSTKIFEKDYRCFNVDGGKFNLPVGDMDFNKNVSTSLKLCILFSCEDFRDFL